MALIAIYAIKERILTPYNNVSQAFKSNGIDGCFPPARADRFQKLIQI